MANLTSTTKQQYPVPDLLSDLHHKRVSSRSKMNKSSPLKQISKKTEVKVTNQSNSSQYSTHGILSMKDILEKCGESDPDKVYEIILHSESLTEVPDLIKFKKVRILDVSCNKIKSIKGLICKDLRELKIYDNDLTDLYGLESCKELTIIQAQHNKITSIAYSIQNLRKLKCLRLDNNKINRIDLRDVASFVDLTSLDVSFNNLCNLTFATSLPHLEELFATNNQIEQIPDFSRCKKLSEIKLSSNLISNALGLRNHPTLQILDLDNNRIENLEVIGPIKNLESLHLNKNKLKSIKDLHKYYPELEVLELSHNCLSEKELFLSEIVQLTEIRELSLSDNCFEIPESEDKPFPHDQMLRLIPELEFLDNVSLKKLPTSQCTPVMRPMTASSAVTIKTVENQIRNITTLMEPIERKGISCYQNLCETLDRLPKSPPLSTRVENQHSIPILSSEAPSTSRTSSRARLRDALEFASVHFASQELK